MDTQNDTNIRPKCKRLDMQNKNVQQAKCKRMDEYTENKTRTEVDSDRFHQAEQKLTLQLIIKQLYGTQVNRVIITVKLYRKQVNKVIITVKHAPVVMTT